MAVISWFISKLDECGMPFYKLLCKVDDFQWDDQATSAFMELKQYLKSLSTLVLPKLMMCCYYMLQPPIQLLAPLSPLSGQRPQYKSSNNPCTLLVRSWRMLKQGIIKSRSCSTQSLGQPGSSNITFWPTLFGSYPIGHCYMSYKAKK
jgi:hypothetical protein